MARRGDTVVDGQAARVSEETIRWLLDERNLLRVMCCKCGHFLTEIAVTEMGLVRLNCKTSECRRLNVLIVGRNGDSCYIEKQWYEERQGPRPRVESPA